MQKDQQKYLLDRARDAGPTRHQSDPRQPKHVSAARKVVRNWERHVYEQRRQRELKFDKAYARVREVIYAGDFAKALIAVRLFEKAHPRGR